MNIYSEKIPSTSFICQPVADDMEVAVEVWSTSSEDFYSEEHISILDTDLGRFAFLSGIFEKRSECIFRKAEGILKKNGFSVSDLIRTWYYVGGILKKEGKETRYDLLNEIRTRFYKEIWKENEYPASTGIGMSEEGVVLDGIAFVPKRGKKIIRIENPLQISSFQYNIPFEKRPKFSRAVFIGNSSSGLIFVSGTASIRGEKVVAKEDVRKQTFITIENIQKLISKENLSRYGIGLKAELRDFASVRVYIKDKRDFEEVREICERYFKDIPKIYLVAEICRPCLLVEIEGILNLAE